METIMRMPNAKSPAQLLAYTLFVLALLWASPGVARAEEAPKGDGEEGENVATRPVGFDLGRYAIKDLRGAEGRTTRLSFQLHTSVAGDQAEQFRELLKTRKQRVRDQVILASRLTEPTDFSEPNLQRFRRRITIRLRRAVPGLKVDDVYLSDFRYLIE